MKSRILIFGLVAGLLLLLSVVIRVWPPLNDQCNVLVANLTSTDFATLRLAQNKLTKMGPSTVPCLLRGIRESKDEQQKALLFSLIGESNGEIYRKLLLRIQPSDVCAFARYIEVAPLQQLSDFERTSLQAHFDTNSLFQSSCVRRILEALPKNSSAGDVDGAKTKPVR
jgi:hypothetical protein